MKNHRFAIGAGVLALLVGAVGPWVSVLGGVVELGPTSNVEISLVVFGGPALLLLSMFLGRATRLATIAVGVLALGEVAYVMVRIQQAKSEMGEWGALVSPGWGLYLASTWIVRKPTITPQAR
jgi:hypothetical protein